MLLMAKSKTKKSSIARKHQELDAIYVLKIVLYLVVGSQWVWLTDAAMTTQVPLPIGLAVGGFFAMHDHFKIDRKIEYAILLVACLIGFWSQVGVTFTLLNNM